MEWPKARAVARVRTVPRIFFGALSSYAPAVIGIVLVGAIGAIAIVLMLRSKESTKAAKERVAILRKKYGRTELAAKIVEHQIWVGQTVEQLVDSLGPPIDIDEKPGLAERRLVYKYRATGPRSHPLWVTIENDRVTGWIEK